MNSPVATIDSTSTLALINKLMILFTVAAVEIWQKINSIFVYLIKFKINKASIRTHGTIKNPTIEYIAQAFSHDHSVKIRGKGAAKLVARTPP